MPHGNNHIPFYNLGHVDWSKSSRHVQAIAYCSCVGTEYHIFLYHDIDDSNEFCQFAAIM